MVHLPYSKIKIDPSLHLAHPLRVHSLLSDFILEDVWRIPVELESQHSLSLVMDHFEKSNDQLLNKGVAGFLFRFRLLIGKLLKWDEKDERDHLVPGTIRFRFAKEEKLTFTDLPAPGEGNFVPVYKLDDEFLSEIENKTVHAAVHFSRVSYPGHSWTVHMAVYVKPKGVPGRIYMALIKPFRLWIVYPAMMNAIKKRWDNIKLSGTARNQLL